MILPLRHEVWLNLLQRIGPHTHGLWRRWHRQAHSNKSCHFCWNLEQLNGICNKYKTTKSLLSNFIKMHVIIEEWLHPFDKIHILRMTDPPKYMIKSWWLKQLTIITQLENSATKVLHISQPTVWRYYEESHKSRKLAFWLANEARVFSVELNVREVILHDVCRCEQVYLWKQKCSFIFCTNVRKWTSSQFWTEVWLLRKTEKTAHAMKYKKLPAETRNWENVGIDRRSWKKKKHTVPEAIRSIVLLTPKLKWSPLKIVWFLKTRKKVRPEC